MVGIENFLTGVSRLNAATGAVFEAPAQCGSINYAPWMLYSTLWVNSWAKQQIAHIFHASPLMPCFFCHGCNDRSRKILILSYARGQS
ncbi:hypothetical protein GUJ93_ZPchr0010g9708 [Zizania palustris]|uniref:Uncharacterized protein n=1 Tax=Zizania palustris TaxID=103762 RepID=A0A8J5W7Y4_ZIZPA|nr:hypothetical protein GUJ93_ZPchr0010g9708 [Zizania palustris]